MRQTEVNRLKAATTGGGEIKPLGKIHQDDTVMIVCFLCLSVKFLSFVKPQNENFHASLAEFQCCSSNFPLNGHIKASFQPDDLDVS